MANKKRKNEIRQQYQRKANEQKYEAVTKRLTIYPWIALGLSVLLLLLMFVTFCNVYNSAPGVGVEVKVNGWSFVIAGLTGNFSSTDAIYGDMAVPFYYYAQEWCESVATFALLAVIAILLNVVAQVITAVKKMHSLNIASAILSAVTAILLIVCYAQGLGMKNGDILTTYCNNNPQCSIRSYAIVPALFALGGVAISGLAAFKHRQASQLLK